MTQTAPNGFSRGERKLAGRARASPDHGAPWSIRPACSHTDAASLGQVLGLGPLRDAPAHGDQFVPGGLQGSPEARRVHRVAPVDDVIQRVKCRPGQQGFGVRLKGVLRNPTTAGVSCTRLASLVHCDDDMSAGNSFA
jgi:hypothetical protein